MSSDIVVIGKVFTANKHALYADGLAIEDGRFTYVGSESGARARIGAGTRVIHLDGLAMPGIVDGHLHLSMAAGANMFQTRLEGAATLAEYTERIAEFAAAHPELPAFRAYGWDEALFKAEGVEPSGAVLDTAGVHVPVIARSYDGHAELANSAALAAAGIGRGYVSKEAGEVVLDESGMPTGLIREWATRDLEDVVPPLTLSETKRAILAEQENLLSLGITQVYEPVMDAGQTVRAAYRALDSEGLLKLRVVSGYYLMPESQPLSVVADCAGDRDGWEGRRYTCSNVKFMIDGVVEGGTAWLSDDYESKPGCKGEPNCDPKVMREFMRECARFGLQIHVHAIGDAALASCLDDLAYARPSAASADWRPTITHLQCVRPQDIARMARLGVIANADPVWHYKEPGYYDQLAVPYLGEERAEHEYPLRSLWSAGCVVSTGTDCPVSDPDPLLGIERGVTRSELGDDSGATALWPHEGVNVERMLLAATINGAYQNFCETDYGSIEVGKVADMTFFDQDLTDIDPHDIHKTRCVLTIVDGKVVFEA